MVQLLQPFLLLSRHALTCLSASVSLWVTDLRRVVPHQSALSCSLISRHYCTDLLLITQRSDLNALSKAVWTDIFRDQDFVPRTDSAASLLHSKVFVGIKLGLFRSYRPPVRETSRASSHATSRKTALLSSALSRRYFRRRLFIACRQMD